MACSLAAGGATGALVLAEQAEQLTLAVVLAPDRPLPQALVAMPLAMLALADALAALGPPRKPIGFAWPDGLLLDGARMGEARLRLDEASAGTLPDWLVVALALQYRLPAAAGEPGTCPERTALLEEGFGTLSPVDLADAFARHLLFWVSRLEDEGVAPVAAEFGARLALPTGEHLRIDPLSFDLHCGGPPRRRRSLRAALRQGGRR